MININEVEKNILKEIKILDGKYVTGKSKAGSDNSAFIDYIKDKKNKLKKKK